jgi:16S rRNA (guanine966-N2)-methyltransferase
MWRAIADNVGMVAPPPRPTAPRQTRQQAGGQVRIIGGRWRGSKLPVLDRSGLRPTADRVRETLFNWLAPVLPGSVCVDLFAGSGALGFEAASRGAARSILVERDPALAASLRQSAARLGATQVEVECADALGWLEGSALPPIDIAFVDPPFALALWNSALGALAGRLSEQAWVYVESTPETVLEIPANWRLHREGRSREVAYRLFHGGRTG